MTLDSINAEMLPLMQTKGKEFSLVKTSDWSFLGIANCGIP